jgi:hypothetical protein
MANRVDPRHLVRLRINLRGTDSFGNPFAQTVFTRDVSARGARLQEIPPLLNPASYVRLEYRGKSARFRVMWVGGAASNEVGVFSLGPCIWGNPLPGAPIAARPPVSAANEQPRR